MKSCTLPRYRKAVVCWAIGCCTVVFVGQSPNAAWAQKPGKPDPKAKAGQNLPARPGNASTMEIAKSEGKLEAIQGNMIKIADANSQEQFLVVSQDTAFKYSGEADSKWLTPGLMVRFTATFDSGKLTAPLKQLEVFTPVVSNRMTLEQMREQTPGIYPEGKSAPEGAKGLFGEDKKGEDKKGGKPAEKRPTSKKDAKEALAPTGAGSQSVRVVGKLIGMQANVMTLFTGQSMQVETDAAMKISVSATDIGSAMNMVAKGDGVNVSGLRDPSKPAYIYAERLEVKAAEKLTQTVAQPTRGGRNAPKGKDAADAKDAKDPKGKPGDKPKKQ